MVDPERTQVLISRAVTGDEDSVRRLLVLYHPRLRGRLLKQMDATMKARIEPEDLLQQVYLEAFRAIGSFHYEGPDSFLRWLFTILDRKLIDEHRALRAECRDVRREIPGSAPGGMNTTYVDLLSRLSGHGSTASQLIRKNEALAVMMACVASLPEHYQQVVRMRFLEGRSVSDVAKALDRSIGSIHMICHRALVQLREQVEKLGVAPEGS